MIPPIMVNMRATVVDSVIRKPPEKRKILSRAKRKGGGVMASATWGRVGSCSVLRLGGTSRSIKAGPASFDGWISGGPGAAAAIPLDRLFAAARQVQILVGGLYLSCEN